MPRIILGAICGVAIGVIDVLLMLPLSFPDKRAAILGAFVNRFSIGFVLGITTLPWPGWLAGLFIGILLSLADAIITKAYLPILTTGAVFGTIVGFLVQRFGR